MLDALPLLVLAALHVGLTATLWGRFRELSHPPTAFVCAVAPAAYGLGAAAYLLLGRWTPGLAGATGATIAIPAGVLASLYPSRRALAGFGALALAAWAACWAPLPPRLAPRGWDASELAVGFYLAVATALALLGLLRGRAGGIERRLLAVAGLPSFAVALIYVVLEARLANFPLVSTSILVGGELVLLLLHRERPGRVTRSRAWTVVVQALLLTVGATLLLGLAGKVGLFPRDPTTFVLTVALTAGLALGFGLARPALLEALDQTFYPEEHRARQRLRELQRELEETRERLRESEHLSLVGQLAASVAHEIKNPLGPIRGYVRVVERELERAGLDSERARRGLEVIRQEVETIDARARRLLELARPPRPELQRTDLAAVAQDVIDLLAASVPPGVHLGWREPPPAAPARADPALVRGALLNVTQNALQALGKGPGTVAFSLEPSEGAPAPAAHEDAAPQPGEQDGASGAPSSAEGADPPTPSAPGPAAAAWVLHVDDDGPGLPAGDPEDLFRPFVSGRDDGHGLGLLIARGSLEALGGALTLSGRAAGNGTRATLRLPRSTREP